MLAKLPGRTPRAIDAAKPSGRPPSSGCTYSRALVPTSGVGIQAEEVGEPGAGPADRAVFLEQGDQLLAVARHRDPPGLVVGEGGAGVDLGAEVDARRGGSR